MAQALKTTQKTEKKYSKKNIPKALIYEVLDGQVLYYKGYKEVLHNQTDFEGIMGSSTLQTVLVNYFIRLFAKTFEEDLYYIAASEAGVHINHKSNLANDIAIYETSVLTPDKINTQYASVPPKYVIEIDIKADLSDLQDYDYVQNKTKKLLQFGTEIVIWVFTSSQMVLVATPDKNWENIAWEKDIEMLPDLIFNIGAYLRKKGIQIP